MPESMSFSNKPIAQHGFRRPQNHRDLPQRGCGPGLGYQRRRKAIPWIKRQLDEGLFGKLVNAEPTSAAIVSQRLTWVVAVPGRRNAGGVMLQIGIHYTDVLNI